MGELWAEIVRQIVEGADVILGAFISAGSASVAAYLAYSRRFKRVDKYRDYADRRQAKTCTPRTSKRARKRTWDSKGALTPCPS